MPYVTKRFLHFMQIILSTCPRQRTLHLLSLPPYKLTSKTNRSKISHAQYNDLKYGKHWPMVVYRKQCTVHTMYRHQSIKYLFTTPDIYCLHNTKLRQYNGHVFTSNLLGRTMNGVYCALYSWGSLLLCIRPVPLSETEYGQLRIEYIY